MRVISGKHKGRPLAGVPGKGTRPTSDKVKESIFNIIGPYFDGGWALDLYAGTGGLAIEALSRGIEKSVLIDKDPKAIAVIKQNIQALELQDFCEIYRTDASRAIKALVKREVPFSLVFLDPPYAQQKIVEQMTSLEQGGLLAAGAWIVAECDISVQLPEQVGQSRLERRAEYGDTAVSIYRFQFEADEVHQN